MSLLLRYRCGSADTWREAVTLNVSRTGLLLSPAHALPPGGAVDLVLTLPACDAFPRARVRCTALVVRQGEEDRAALAIRRYRFLKPGDADEVEVGVSNDTE
jgi:hypothetical protein